MSKRLYAVVSDKRGVLYVGEDEEKRNRVLINSKDVTNKEMLGNYIFERGHERLLLERRDSLGAVCIDINDERLIRALKDFL